MRVGPYMPCLYRNPRQACVQVKVRSLLYCTIIQVPRGTYCLTRRLSPLIPKRREFISRVCRRSCANVPPNGMLSPSRTNRTQSQQHGISNLQRQGSISVNLGLIFLAFPNAPTNASSRLQPIGHGSLKHICAVQPVL